MTIRRGAAWGRAVAPPDGLVVALSDADVVQALGEHPTAPVAVGGGDLARTLGNPPIVGRPTLNALEIDLVEVRLDGGRPHRACAHVVLRPPWWRGGWLRGAAVVVMNAEYLGRWDVAPRGHPNDGRAEVFEVASSMGVRTRLRARRRARTAAHVPHPDIVQRSIRAAQWSFPNPVEVTVDGRRVGAARTIDIAVVPDAATVLA
jgi:hypothetical protein